MKAAKRFRSIALDLFLILIAAACLLPFWWTIVMSTLPANLTINDPPMIPGNQFLVNLEELLSKVDVFRSFANSLFVAVIQVSMTIFFSALSAFAYAKYTFKGKNIFFMFTICTMFMPSQLAWIGQIEVYRSWGILDTYWPFFLGALGNAFVIVVIRGYIETGVPNSLLESARLDGASDIRMFFSIVVPIVRPVIASMAIIQFVGSWNNFSGALMILYTPEKYTLPLALSVLQSTYWQNTAAQSIGVLISLIPIVTVYLFASKQFIAALTSGAVKE